MLEITTTKLSFWAYISMACSVLIFVGVWQLRSKVRTTFQLPGNCLTDCCVSFFCSSCAIAQMATHVKSYKKGSCSFGAPDELPPYNSHA
jgi:Cys-rich protein (TIGR01571 family)